MRAMFAVGMAAIGLALAGCAQTEIQQIDTFGLRGNEDNPHALNEPFLAMTDSALMSDMTVVDMHFVPQTAQLTSLGLDRMARCAAFLKQYGGVLRYDPQTTNESLIERRVTMLSQYLTDAGLDMATVSVVVGMAAEPGMSGGDAIRAIEKSRTQDDTAPADAGSSAGMTIGG